MTSKHRLILAGSVLVLLAGVATYMYMSGEHSAATAADAQNLETLRNSPPAANAPPPVKFTDIPAEPPTGRRVQTK